MTKKENTDGFAALRNMKASREQTPVQEVEQSRPVRQQVVETMSKQVMVGGRVPQEKALAYDGLVLKARRYFPNLDKQTALEALLSLIETEDIFERWLDRIEELKKPSPT